LLEHPDIDAVYISLPNSLHHQWSIRTLQAGKHVLCEKPIGASAVEAEEMFAVAQQTGRVLVEAFMYRCQPVIKEVLELVRNQAIGQVKLIRSNFTFNRPPSSDDVRYQADLAGGSLMDIGCYCINFTRAIVGREPTEVHAVVHRYESGVDDWAAGTMSFGGEVLSTFTCGMSVSNERTTFIGGSDGYIKIDFPWFSDGTFEIVRGDLRTPPERETKSIPNPIEPYALEAEAFARIVQDGDAPWITKEDSIGNMKVLDELRRQVL
jgi:predicted dehydrogenase